MQNDCRFLEIYKETVIDLLDPSESKNLTIRDSNTGETVIIGIKEVEVTTPEEIYDILKMGSNNRTTAATKMNSHSSRSHAICTLNFEIQEINEQEETNYITSKFRLVDLAGSERLKKTLV